MRTRRLSVVAPLLAAVLPAGCGSAPPEVPPADPPATACPSCEPPADAPDPAPAADTGRMLPAAPSQAQLAGVRPQDGIQPGTPVSIDQMLAMRHPPSEMRWRALPPGSDAQLRATMDDKTLDAFTRVRAMEGLSTRKTEGLEAPLVAVMNDEGADIMVRRGAARALGRGYVTSGDSTAAKALITALDDKNDSLREAVVFGLTLHVRYPEVRAALEKRLKVEHEEEVEEALAAALAQ